MIFQPVLYVIGYLLSALSIILCVPAGVDAFYGDNQWQSFTFSSLICLFFGIILILANKSDNFNMTIKQAFLFTTLSWVFIAFFGSLSLLPFYLYETFYLGDKLTVDSMSIFWILIAAISPGIIAFTLYSKIQKYLGASITGFTLYLFVVYGAFYGIFFFDEKLYMSHYLGGALVLLGVYFAKKI